MTSSHNVRAQQRNSQLLIVSCEGGTVVHTECCTDRYGDVLLGSCPGGE